MHYENIKPGLFLARPNRFIAHVWLDGGTPHPPPTGAPSPQGEGRVICHVKNTGRCRELLIPGATVYLQESDNPARKTKYDLIAVEKKGPSGTRLINMDAQAPNKVFGEWASAGHFLPGLTLLRPETTWGNSRFDFYWEAGDRRGFVEVKGVTLEEDGAVRFPDAPTERGVKHLEELRACMAEGYEAGVCFVVQMADVAYFSPNDRTHPAFGDALRRAAAAGVRVLACECAVTPDSLSITRPVDIRL